jgi:DNA-binding LacI/PurR family transcriptional regulator
MPRTARSPSLADVASRCGVNISTVSRVLRNKFPPGFSVTAGLRERVVEAAAELNYQPSIIAQALSGKKAGIVAISGAQASWLAHPGIYSSVIAAATAAVNASGLIACATFPHPDYGEFGLLPWHVDGVLALQPPSADCLGEMENAGIPYVSVNGPAGPSGSAVLVDEAKNVRVAVRHLVKLKHERIYFWAPSEANHYSVAERRDAFDDEVACSGLPTVRAKDDEVATAEACLRTVVQRRGATAILAYDDRMAIDLLGAARVVGLAVPADVSIVGFNNVPGCEYVHPALTTVSVPSEDMGRVAAERLIERIRGRRPRTKRTVRLKGKLIIRESTARSGR